MTAASAYQVLPIRRLACARCGTPFDCGSGGSGEGCWCMDETYRMPLPDQDAGDCLCPSCLSAAASLKYDRRIP